MTREAMEEAREALAASSKALDDWTCTYASEFCDPEHVHEAWKRIQEGGGTLAYIADTNKRNHATISKLDAALSAQPEAVTIEHLPGTTGDSLEDAMKWAAQAAQPSPQQPSVREALASMCRVYDAMGCPRGPARILAEAALAEPTAPRAFTDPDDMIPREWRPLYTNPAPTPADQP